MHPYNRTKRSIRGFGYLQWAVFCARRLTACRQLSILRNGQALVAVLFRPTDAPLLVDSLEQRLPCCPLSCSHLPAFLRKRLLKGLVWIVGHSICLLSS